MTHPFDPQYRDSWKAIERNCAPMRPSVGKTVRVLFGRKRGVVGKVFWHGRDRYSDLWRGSQAHEAFMMELMGTFGYACGIETETGEKFFRKATDVEVIQDAPCTYEVSLDYQGEPRKAFIPEVTCASEALAEVNTLFPGAQIKLVSVYQGE